MRILTALFTLAALALSACASAPEPRATDEPTAESWERTIDRVANAVVVLRVDVPRAFDTEGPGSFVGTGFVVDAERGLILTNRHLVQPGPVVAEAAFLNAEEIDIHAVYRDPVHDFGIFRFDPADVRYADLVELELAPEAARVGMDIRVVGNDAGEKLSILSGVLARLDRPAPDYGPDTYNDFNTFYLQAASDTSGGSSGSPVVAADGRVVGLNAGGSWRSSSSYYLPLDRVVRALDLVRAGRPVTRGTIQTIWQHTPFDELGRLGLAAQTEALVRGELPREVGMLIVDQVVPGGPADGMLEPGDILVRLNGAVVTRFPDLEAVLDESVGETVQIEVDRAGEALTLDIPVGDLHAITPSEYLEVGDGVLHPLSYQQARNFHIPVDSGVYVARTGYVLSSGRIPLGALIRAIDGQPVTGLDDVWRILGAAPDGQRLTVRWAPIEDERLEQVGSVVMNRNWFPMQRCRRDDETGLWPCEAAPESTDAVAARSGSTTFTASGPGPTADLAPSLVMVEFDIPFRVEGVWGSHFTGTGLVVDATRGLVVVDRDTVPIALGDVQVTFGGSLRVPGRVEYIHPTHNLAVVSYDPALVGDTPVRAARLRTEELEEGDAVWLVGLDPDFQLVSRDTRISRIGPLALPFPSGRPQFRDVNIEVIDLQDQVDTLGGVLANDRGEVLALWTSFHVSDSDDLAFLAAMDAGGLFRGISVELLSMILDPLSEGREVGHRVLGAELAPITLADARDLGLSDEHADRLERHDPRRREALTVVRPYGGSDAERVLRGGDVLISVGGAPVTRFLEVERAAQAETVTLEVLRDGAVEQLEVATMPVEGRGVERVLAWGGLLLHEPHLEVSSQQGLSPEGVYVAFLSYGGPAGRSGIRATRRIVEVNGVPTPDLDAFIEVVRDLPDRSSVRMRTVDLERQVHMDTMRLDLHYWPTFELRLGDDGRWRRM